MPNIAYWASVAIFHAVSAFERRRHTRGRARGRHATGERARTQAPTLDTPLTLTQTRRGAMKHLCGDRLESVPRPQRAKRAHESARRRPQAAAAAASRWRSADGARSARFFSREAPPHSTFLQNSGQTGRLAQVARHARARGLQANHAKSWPGPSIPLGARSARKFSRKSFSKEFLPLSGATQSV